MRFSIVILNCNSWLRFLNSNNSGIDCDSIVILFANLDCESQLWWYRQQHQQRWDWLWLNFDSNLILLQNSIANPDCDNTATATIMGSIVIILWLYCNSIVNLDCEPRLRTSIAILDYFAHRIIPTTASHDVARMVKNLL